MPTSMIRGDDQEVVLCQLTPSGLSGLAVLNLQGPGLPALLENVFAPKGKADFEADRLYMGDLLLGGDVTDEVILDVRSWSRSSYEVEITCHGGRMPNRLIRGLEAVGVRRIVQETWLAGRGCGLWDREIRQAYLCAKTAKALQCISKQANGLLRHAIRECHQALAAGGDVLSGIYGLLDTWKYGRALLDGIRIVLTGRPNAGKSTLLNALVEDCRMIVSPEPGTTRDVIEVESEMNGFPVTWMDGAGMHETDHVLEKEGAARLLDKVRHADLAVFVKDETRPWTGEDTRAWRALEGVRRVLVMNKMDLENRVCRKTPVQAEVCRVSGLCGTGLAHMRECVFRVLEIREEPPVDGPLIFSATLHRSLQSAARCLRDGQRDRAAGELMKWCCPQSGPAMPSGPD